MSDVINLRKGDRVAVGFNNITIGLGWEPNEGTGAEFDLDVSAIMINSSKKLPTAEHFIFYNNYCGNGHDKSNPCKDCGAGKFGLIHTGDDPDGKSSNGGDDESIIVDLTKVPDEIQEILFIVTIDNAVVKKQNFGQVRDSYIRLVDNRNGREMIKYELGEDFSIETGIEFGRLYKRNNEWRFDASGIGYREDLAFFLSKYFSGQINK